MPIGLYALAVAAFAMGMAEFIVVGILPAIAYDIHIDVPSAGLLVTLYAVGVAVSAPVLTAVTSQANRRLLASGLMCLFIFSNIIAWLAPSFSVLLISRVLAGISHGVFFSIASVIASGLVAKEKAGRAISIMFTGLTVALVTGGPLGTLISDAFGWRAAFLGIAVTGIIAMAAMLFWLPKDLKKSASVSFLSQFEVLIKPRLLLVFTITAIGHCGSFVAFTFLSEILQGQTGYSLAAVGIIFVCYGVGVMLGNNFFARFADRRGAIPALLWVYTLLSLALLTLGFTASSKIAVIPVIIAWGAFAFGNVPVLQLYVMQQAKKILPEATESASSMNISAFNIGIAAGAWFGGIVVAKAGVSSVGEAAGTIVAVNIILVLLSGYLDKRNYARGSSPCERCREPS
ncbi:MFS transporter [Kluyvera intermedia]|jgi:predicted MFS family arabinose efflux permease|uniref:MFS transporter n=4 Tax=Kluyvera intermedia TaxID=61648 RepID=A0ABX6DSD2_KLUIN|nr:MFS transporter [Kluyvera intermedia]QGH31288.1 MFS transporter [Kluyvera intermedia]QGH40270.1 MFS transporter [Kluyvera intermedia]